MTLVYRNRRAQATALLLLLAPAAWGHSTAELHLRLQAHEHDLELQTSIDLHVLRDMVELDRDGDGRMSPEEIQEARPELARYLSNRLRLRSGGQDCPVELVQERMVNVASLQLRMRARCAEPPEILQMDCGLLAGTRHRLVMFVEVVSDRGVTQLRLDDRHRRIEIDLGLNPPWPPWLHGLLVAAGLAGLTLALAGLSYRRSRA